MNQNQTEVVAVAAVAQTSIVSALTLAYGASVQNAQMAFAVSMTFDCLPSLVNDVKGFTFASYVDEVVERSGHGISKKTIQNNMTLTRALLDKHRVVLATYTKDEAGVNAFMDWMRAQVASTTYTLKRDDLIAWCKGESSEADKRAKLAADNAAARDLIAAQAAAPAAPATPAAPVTLAEHVSSQQATDESKAAAAEEERKAAEEQQAREAAAAEQTRIAGLAMQAEREKREQAERELAAAQQAQAEAEKAAKQAQAYLITVAMDIGGEPNIVVDRQMSAAFLDKVSKELAAMAKALRKQQQTAMGAALANAQKAA